MDTQEIKCGLVWNVKCQECEANIGAKGIKSVSCAETWIFEHAKATGHTQFNMNVYGYSIIIKTMDDEKLVAV